MVIRNIRMEDAGALWQLQSDLDHDTKYMMYEPGERKREAGKMEALIKSAVQGDDLILVAEESGLVGFLYAGRGKLRRIQHTAFVIVGILSNDTGKGIGSRFFGELDIWARANGLTRLELTVMCKNLAAKHVYEKHGFVVEGIRKNALIVEGEYVDEFYMAKYLES